MNDISMEERIAIKDSARSLKKYGSTSSNSKRCESFIKHQVVQTDTLQGLALKYGVSTEQIRRANTLWANDSIFLRKILLIPILSGPASNSGVDSAINAIQPTTTTESHQLLNNNNNNNNNHQRESCSNAENSEQETEDESYNDFLVKIDCAIASTKSQVMMAHDNSQFVEEDSIFWRRKGALSRLKQQRQHREETIVDTPHNHLSEEDDRASVTSNSNESSDVPTTTVVMMTQGRKVRNSLQRLEKQQQDIFEL